MKNKEFTALGLMSGTSMDGIDVSLVKSDGEYRFQGILNHYEEFSDDLRQKLVNLRSLINDDKDLKKYANELKDLERKITLFHSKIVNDISQKYQKKIDLIGFHGLTIFHDSTKKISLQLGDGKLLSQLTKHIVINDFRQKDLENEGQGAPLTPVFHRLICHLINKKNKIQYPIILMNIGGITNITKINNNRDPNEKNLSAYDIAPGNCLIDEWVRKNTKQKFDHNGNLARSGKVDQLVFNQIIDNLNIDSYEKSLDIKDFDLSFARGLSFLDGCATITLFTAYLIAEGIKQNDNNSKICLICGGGRKNNFLIKNIKKYSKQKKLKFEKIEKYNLDGDFIESQAFGYLAIRTYLKKPISYPKTTRCKNPTIGGVINRNFSK